MIDPRYHKRIEVRRKERGGGMIWFPQDRMSEVRALLDQHAVPYWENATAVSDRGGPYIASITLSVKANLDQVQQLFDSLP